MKAAIIGGGVIGGGWAARFLLMGWDVAVYDPAPGARESVEAVLRAARQALPMLYERALPPEGRISFEETIAEACADADHVQESVPERLDLKHRVLAEIDAATPAGVPVGSSTSGFKPSELREGLENGGRVFVAHPFVPVYLLPLIEIVGVDGDAAALARLQATIAEIGQYPLTIGKEIDAHIADRFLEAVWREALWLVRDDIATTGEIDEAIRMGFGLRWAQKGMFETYRIAGGKGGMAHFLAQFGPALKWPWTKLMDVPDLDDALVAKIAAQSDAQAGDRDIATIEGERDRNLVAILRALKGQGDAAGRVILDHEATFGPVFEDGETLVTLRRTVPHDWTDYNGHMNESRYGQVWSDASDSLLTAVGTGPGNLDRGSWFTVETHTRFLAETHAGEAITCETRVGYEGGKALTLEHEMKRGAETVATCTQVLLFVSMETRRSAVPPDDIADALRGVAARHGRAA